MKILITGTKGYIGTYLRGLYPDAVCPSIDIADEVAVARALEENRPDVLINAAGKTGRPNVDWCEEHKMETVRSNLTGALVLLEQTLKRGVHFVHIGSGCIYQGDNGGGGFTEEDAPNFTGSFYSKTKLWSDQMLREFPVLQLRLRMPFDGSNEPRNLITKLKNYRRVLDEPNSITYIPDFLRTLDVLVRKGATGTFNVVNPGVISPYVIMQRYKALVDHTHSCERLDVGSLSQVVTTERSNCHLNTDKLRREGIELLPVEIAIDEALASMMRNEIR